MPRHTYRPPPRVVAPTKHGGILFRVTRQYARPTSDQSDGNWLNEAGSNTDLYASLDESSPNDSDYIISGEHPANNACKVRLSSVSDPLTSSGHIVRYRYYKRNSSRVDLVVRLKQGGTTIASWTHTDISATPVLAEQTLSGAEADAITDYSILDVEFEANQV